MAAPEEGRGPARAVIHRAAGVDEEASGPRDLSVEVAWVQLFLPDSLIDVAQLGDGELGRAEGRGKRGVLEFGLCPLDSIAKEIRFGGAPIETRAVQMVRWKWAANLRTVFTNIGLVLALWYFLGAVGALAQIRHLIDQAF